MGIFDRFRTIKPHKRLSKYNIETISSKNELISSLKDIIKAKDIVIKAHKTALSEIIDLEDDGYVLKPESVLGSDTDLVDVVTSSINSRDDIPRPLKQAISSYTDSHRLELNSILNEKINQLIKPPEKKENENYGV